MFLPRCFHISCAFSFMSRAAERTGAPYYAAALFSRGRFIEGAVKIFRRAPFPFPSPGVAMAFAY